MGTGFNLITGIFVLLLSLHLYAEGGGESEGGGEGGEAPAAESSDQKANKQLMDVEKQVASLSAKIQAKNQSIQTLLREKSEERDPEKLAETLKLIQQEHRDLEKLTREYNTQLGILQYRFPERGLAPERRYERLKTQSLEEMEKSLGVEAHLKRSREEIRTVYGIKKKQGRSRNSQKTSHKDEELLQPATISK